MNKTTSLYGFSPQLAPFSDRTPAEQVEILQSWGNTVVFGGYREPGFLAAARDAGLPVYAEFGCFVGESLWGRFPGARPVLPDGSPMMPDGPYWGVNPAIEAVRDERLAALERLVTEHAIDGVWLDFIRWPCHWEVPRPTLAQSSFDPGTLSAFSQSTGILLPIADPPAAAQLVLEQHREAWSAWRRDRITSWVAEARQLIDRVRPGTTLGLFGVPWRIEDYDGAILDIIGQDYRALGAYIDAFSPMVYHTMCGFDTHWIELVTEEVHARSGKPVWPIVQSVDEPLETPVEEYASALDAVLGNTAAEGVLVFTMEGALEPAKLAVTRDRFATANR